MEKEKYVFDRNQFHKGFEKYCYDNDFIPYEEMLSIVDYDLKEKGIKSRYRYIIEQLDDCYKDFVHLTFVWGNDVRVKQYYERDLVCKYIADKYQNELKELNFVKDLYEYTKIYYNKYTFSWLESYIFTNEQNVEKSANNKNIVFNEEQFDKEYYDFCSTWEYGFPLSKKLKNIHTKIEKINDRTTKAHYLKEFIEYKYPGQLKNPEFLKGTLKYVQKKYSGDIKCFEMLMQYIPKEKEKDIERER